MIGCGVTSRRSDEVRLIEQLSTHRILEDRAGSKASASRTSE